MFKLHNPVKSDDLQSYLVTSHPCPTCKQTIDIEITPEKLYAYNQGAYAQHVLDNFSSVTRERFISGVCGPCWVELYGDWENEE
jgi:formate-dependent nitrite reductase cytochrome c552 subunit